MREYGFKIYPEKNGRAGIKNDIPRRNFRQRAEFGHISAHKEQYDYLLAEVGKLARQLRELLANPNANRDEIDKLSDRYRMLRSYLIAIGQQVEKYCK